jgi:nucleoside-triphosphatase
VVGAVPRSEATALLLTGRPGVGKTTVIRTVVERLQGCAGGFYTEEIRERNQRVGFRLVALDGPRGTLARVNGSSSFRVGKYRVNLKDLEQVGVAALQRAVVHPHVAVVVVDEIGKMELFSPAFCEAVMAALESPKLVLATVMSRPHAWVDTVKARPDVATVEVTQANRQMLPEQVLRWLQKMEGGDRKISLCPDT